MKKKLQHTIGSIQHWQKNQQNWISFVCELKKKSILNCMLLDQRGQLLWQENYCQNKGKSTVELCLPYLQTGMFNFWIQVDGQLSIRSLYIDRSNEKKWVQQLKRWFYVRLN